MKNKNITIYYVIILLCKEKNNIIIVQASVVNNHTMIMRFVGILLFLRAGLTNFVVGTL